MAPPCRRASLVSRWGEHKVSGGWRDEGEESVPMLSRDHNTRWSDQGERNTETDTGDSEEEVLVRSAGQGDSRLTVIQS